MGTIRTVLRKYEREPTLSSFTQPVYRIGQLVVNPQSNELSEGDQTRRLDPILMDILVYLIEHAPAVVSSEELLDKFWSGRVVEESTIHRRISQLRAALGETARNPKYVATVPKRGYRLVAEVSQINATEGLGQPEQSPLKARLGFGISTVIVMAGFLGLVLVALLTYFQFFNQPGPQLYSAGQSGQELRIAVLPFQDFSDLTNNSHLVAGFEEDVLAKLRRLDSVLVTSRTSTMRYHDERTRSIPDIARELGVSHIVEGSFRRVKDRIEIAVQLIVASSEEQLWAESYDRGVADIFTIQNDIVREVAIRLIDDFSEEKQLRFSGVPTDDLQAYELVLKGREQITIGTVESLAIAAQLMKSAIERDPLLAEAHSGYSRALFLQTFLGVPWKDVRARVLEASARALELDPNSASIHANYAHIQAGWVGDEQTGLRHYERAFQLEPNNSFVLLHYGAHLSLRLGETERGLPLLERAMKLNPLSGEVSFYLGRTLEYLGRQERALEVTVRGLQYDPDDIDLRALEISLLLSRGDVFQGLSRGYEQILLDPLNVNLLAGPVILLIFMDEIDAAQLWADRLEALYPMHPQYFFPQLLIYRVRKDIEGIENLYGKWQTMNRDERMSAGNVDEAFGEIAQVYLLSLKADQARREGQSAVESALRSQAVELAGLSLLNADEEISIDYRNQDLAFYHAVNLELLGREDDATTILKEIERTVDPEDMWQLTWSFMVNVLLGEHDRAMQLLRSKPDHMYLLPLLKLLNSDEFGLYSDFLQNQPFSRFYDSIVKTNNSIKLRIREEIPELLSAEIELEAAVAE